MISQVVLSFGIPFALVPLVLLTRRADVMGAAGQPPDHHRGGQPASPRLIIALNVYLLYNAFFVAFFG